MRWRQLVIGAALAGGAAAAAYVGLVTAAVPIDVGVGRRQRPLGPLLVDIQASRDAVFDLLAEPYLGRQTRAMAEKLTVLEHGSDMALALHRTPLRGGLVARTVETVRFTRPQQIDFRLVRGPVPHVVEQFKLTDHDGGTRLEYRGELGSDGWAAGTWWGDLVALRWEQVVADTFNAVKDEAERRYGQRGTSGGNTPE
jgi:hypothetical protein